MLNGVCPGFIERVAAGCVGFHLFVGVGTHRDIGHAKIGSQFEVRDAKRRDPRVNLMRMSAQLFQHHNRFRHIARLSENIISIRHRCIRADDDMFRARGGQRGARFRFRQSQNVRVGAFIGMTAFIRIGDRRVEHPIAQRKKLPAPRRIGRQQQKMPSCHGRIVTHSIFSILALADYGCALYNA